MTKVRRQVPMCFVCRKPVDAFVKDMRHEVEFIAMCHGKQESVRLPSEAIMGLLGIELGEAFRPAGLLL